MVASPRSCRLLVPRLFAYHIRDIMIELKNVYKAFGPKKVLDSFIEAA